MSKTIIVAVGSENKAKVRSAEIVLPKIFPLHSIQVIPVKADSGVSAQPMSDEESIKGATNRARQALLKTNADYGIGMEGGVQKVGEKWFECGWIVVVDKHDNIGLGSSARFELSKKIMDRILAGVELADVIDDLSGLQDVRSNEGAMGVLTNSLLPRADVYSQAIIFAFSPFISPAVYWT